MNWEEYRGRIAWGAVGVSLGVYLGGGIGWLGDVLAWCLGHSGPLADWAQVVALLVAAFALWWNTEAHRESSAAQRRAWEGQIATALAQVYTEVAKAESLQEYHFGQFQRAEHTQDPVEIGLAAHHLSDATRWRDLSRKLRQAPIELLADHARPYGLHPEGEDSPASTSPTPPEPSKAGPPGTTGQGNPSSPEE